jgi:3-oxoacyl-(acyl-carrier-protein) synthase
MLGLLCGSLEERKPHPAPFLHAVVAVQAHRLVQPQLPCQVVACVPQDELAAVPWAAQEDPRRTARFMSYALTAAAEALQDSGWHPETAEQRRATGVAIGAGMSSTADMAEAGVLLVRGIWPFILHSSPVRPFTSVLLLAS